MSLPGKGWMDEDGKHVWWSHDCIRDGKRKELHWMLPYPDWREHGGAITPSIVCTVPGCNFHSAPLIGPPPENWTPRGTIGGSGA